MSNYRDDAIATAVASDETWVGWGAIGEDVGRIAATAIVGIGVMAGASAVAGDEAYSRTLFMPSATAVASDESFTQVHGAALVADAAKVSDPHLRGRVAYTASAEASASDEITGLVRTVAKASATITDELITQRRVSALLTDEAKGAASAVFRALLLAEDELTISAEAFGGLRVGDMAEAGAIASDEAFSSLRVTAIAAATATASTEAITLLRAVSIISDSAVISDQPLFTDGTFGQAWTANNGNWAMSRYAPYGFDHLAAINGVLFGCNDDGVYMLCDGDETINASVTTGKLDLGEGMLAHPVAAFTEYDLVGGDAFMDVTTTQAGVTSTYSYTLPPKLADELTNGRFVFGRGLRGRHFALTLRIDAKRAHINDLSIQTAKTTRRI